MTEIKDTLVIYHKNCADGFGAAYACWLKFKDTADYAPLQYGFELSELPDVTGRVVYIVDFSLPREMFEAVISQARHVYWFDHHKTAFEMWCPDLPFTDGAFYQTHDDKATIVLDNRRSGALLTWNMMFPEHGDATLFVLLDDYDRWKFTYETTKPFNKGLWAQAPWSFEQWAEMDIGEVTRTGRVLQEAHDKQVTSCVNAATTGAVIACPDGIAREGLAANCSAPLTSDVGHQLAVKSGTFGLLWSVGKKGPQHVSCSLRSDGDYDVSYIAKQFGGGGHKNAAGFETTIETLTSWLRVIEQ